MHLQIYNEYLKFGVVHLSWMFNAIEGNKTQLDKSLASLGILQQPLEATIMQDYIY